MKKRFCVILAAMLALSLALAGCASPSSPGGGGYSGSLEPITFTFYSEDGTREQPWTTPIAQEITKLTGVSLQFDYPVGGLGVRIPLMTASGEYPDLIYGKGEGAPQLMEAGALVDLTDMIDKSKFVKNFYGEELLPRLWRSADDHRIYSFGAYPIKQPVWNVESSMPIQNAVLKEFGYPEVRTVYDVEDLIRRYKDKYPEIDGRPTIGLTLNNADGWRYIIDLGNPSGFLAGFPDNGEWIIDESTYEAKIKYLNPAIKEYYVWLNKMWNEGLLDPDSFTQTNDDYTAKIANGQVLALVSPQWQYNEGQQAMRQNGLDERTYAQMPITWSKDVQPIGSYDIGWSGGWGVSITTACKDPQRAFDFIDWMCSDEGLVLRYWGIEGVHYDIVDGKRVQKPDVRQKLNEDPDYGNSQGFDWQYPFPAIGDGNLDSTGSTYTTNTTESIIENYPQASRDTLAAYNAKMWADLFPPTSSFKLSPFGAAWQIEIPTDSEINDLMQYVQNTWLPRRMSEVVMASPGDFETLWEAAIQELYDNGVERLNSMFTEMVKEKARAWGN